MRRIFKKAKVARADGGAPDMIFSTHELPVPESVADVLARCGTTQEISRATYSEWVRGDNDAAGTAFAEVGKNMMWATWCAAKGIRYKPRPKNMEPGFDENGQFCFKTDEEWKRIEKSSK